MKVSELTLQTICSQIRENPEELSAAEKELIEAYKDAAISYIKTRCGIDGVEVPDEKGRMLDNYPDIAVAVLVLISDMYDNRQTTVDSKNPNKVVENIIGQHDFNLVGGAG